MPKTTEMTFAPIAGRGIEFAKDAEHVYLRLPLSRDGAQASASGKMLISSSTAGGWTDVPGTELRMNLNAGFKNRPAA
jgi:hypothetical protein